MLIEFKSVFVKIIISFSLIFIGILSDISDVNAATYAAQVILYSTESNNHSFLVIYNKSSSSIKVGHHTVAKDGSCTIGTWGNIKEHVGIWYNLEGYYSMAKHVSVSKYITAAELSTMNSSINAYDKWNIFVNCSSFATETWNSISDVKVSAGVVNTPASLASSIKSKFPNSYVTNRSIPTKTRNNFYYHTSTSIVQCSNPTGGGSSSGSGSTSRNMNQEIYDDKYVNSSTYFDFENN